jgi:hypothetical protein
MAPYCNMAAVSVCESHRLDVDPADRQHPKAAGTDVLRSAGAECVRTEAA